MKIITLCGSTKFKHEFIEWNRNLTEEGNIVLSVAFYANPTPTEQLRPELKLLLDSLHMNKIAISNTIFILNVDGYIGWSTANEIAWAKKLGKEIIYLNAVSKIREVDNGNLE